MMDTLMQDIRYAFRILARRPAFAVLALLTLTLGIGANTAIFSVIYSVLLKPLPYPDPDSLAWIHSVDRQGRFLTVSILDFQDIVQKTSAFESAALINPETFNLTGQGEPERVAGASVSASFFNVLGVHPILGSGFDPSDENPGMAPVAIVSYGFWQRRLGGRNNAIGEHVKLDGAETRIAGVAPRGFSFPSRVDVWRPLRFAPGELDPNQRGARYLHAVGRLKTGMSLEEARARVAAVGAELQKQFPDSNGSAGASILRLQDYFVRNIRKALMVLLGAVGFVMLIACVNVANLFLVHAAQRESEVAVRTALGAGRGRLVRQFLVESMILTLVSSIPGVLSALWITEVVKRMGPPDLPRLAEIGIHPPVLLFTFFLSILTGLIVGLVPALQSVRAWNEALKSAGQRTTSSRTRARNVLVVAEIALALMLLAGAGLLIRSFVRLQQVDPGFISSRVITFALSLSASRYPELHQSAAFYVDLIRKLTAAPGVESVGAVYGLPMSKGFAAGGSFERSDRPDQSEEPEAGVRVITPGYFQTMGIPLRSGRAFRDSDDASAEGVAILNEEAARRYWPGEDPLGKQLRLHISLIGEKSRPRTIVGVAGNVLFNGLDGRPEPEVFIPHAQHPVTSMMVVARTAPDAGMSAPAAAKLVRSLDPDLPVWDYRSMDQVLAESVSQRRFTMMLLAAFGAAALLLAGVGIYGVLSYSVAQRTREIGLRMAIGAARSDVLRQFVKEGFVLVVAGLCAGMISAIALTRVLSSLLFQIPPRDPFTLTAVALVLGTIGILAGLVPAMRASRTDPMAALRCD